MNTIQVIRCRTCPFFTVSMDGMECGNPYFKFMGAYSNMIIDQSNVENIPEKCPLRTENVVTVVQLSDFTKAKLNGGSI